jgi:hypothetical protein
MIELKEHDTMLCRACGREERASEGYPCAECGTFVCLMCTMRGVTLCEPCSAKQAPPGASAGPSAGPSAAPKAGAGGKAGGAGPASGTPTGAPPSA